MEKNLILLLVVAIISVLDGAIGIELSDIYESDVYKISVDYNAPIKAPEETVINLKRLLRLVPEIRWTEDNLKNSKEALKNEIFHIMRKDLEFLISISKPNEQESCSHDYMYTLYTINDDPNLLTSQTKDKNYGPNMLTYISAYKGKLVNYCGQQLSNKIKSIPSDQLEAVHAARDYVFPHGVTNAFFYLNEESPELANGLIMYLKSYVKLSISKEQFKKAYFNLETSCNNYLVKTNPTTFLMLAFEKDRTLADSLMKNQFLMDTAMEVKICSLVSGKNQYKKLKDTAGVGFKSKLKQLF